MSALTAMNRLDEWANDDEVPLVRTMFALATRIARRIVVRRPVILFEAESTQEGDEGPVHEVVARTGLLLRSPVALLRWQRPVAARSASEPGAGERPRRA